MSDEGHAPPSVRWLWRLRDRIAHTPRRLIRIGALLVVIAVASTGISMIESGDTGVLLRFGKVVRDDLPAGLVTTLPRVVDKVVSLDTAEVQRLSLAEELERLPDLVTGDENLIRTALAVQFRIASPGEFLFASEDVESVVEQIVRAELVEAVASHAVDDVLTSAKSLIQQQIRIRAQERLARLRLGVSLVTVNLRSVEPPREASAAFRDVLGARSRSAERVSRVGSQEDQALALARAEAHQLVSRAEAEASAREQSARSTAERFRGLVERDRLSSSQTRMELLAAARVAALSEARVIVIEDGAPLAVDVYLGAAGRP